jgi:tight adherence protein B
MVSGALAFGAFVSLSVFLLFVALWRLAEARDPVEERMRQYGITDEVVPRRRKGQAKEPRRKWGLVSRLLGRFGLGPRLAESLMRAGVPLTAAEFSIIALSAGVTGFAVGTLLQGAFLGLIVGVLAVLAPVVYLREKESRRRRAITWQLPEALTLLTGALRAGYGLSQALNVLVDKLPPPASTEFATVVRAVGLGMPVNEALEEMAERVGSDDVALVVTAINVQNEMGGNLAQTLETIADTIRERIFMFRQVRVLTAQQRLTALMLVFLPIGVAFMMFLLNPEYIGELFKPGPIRLVPVVALLMQGMGFLVMRKIIDIEV